MKKETLRLLVTSSAYFLFSLVTLIVIIFAWFSIGSQADALIDDIQSVGADTSHYFYVYDNEARQGSTNYTLIDNVGTNKYVSIANPKPTDFIPKKVKPNDRYSFALKVDVVSTNTVSLDIYFGNVVSSNVPVEHLNQSIQIAFEYEVKKIVYANLGSTTTEETAYTSPKTIMDTFKLGQATYKLVDDLLFTPENQAIIIFFDLYFKPEGVSYLEGENLIPLESSNVFMNQKLVIHKIWMDFDFI